MKSKERVKKHGEVYTPPDLVSKMCDQIPKEIWRDPTKIFGDITGCGNGNFLVEIVKRRIEHGLTPVQAFKTIYGIDILRDNVQECHRRMIDVAKKTSGEQPTIEWCELVTQNVVCADALTYDMKFEKNEKAIKYIEILYNKLSEN